MPYNAFPPLSVDEWKDTRDTLRLYAKVVGKVRRALSPPFKHWWHAALELSISGLTTTPLPAGNLAVELELDLIRHRLHIRTNVGDDVPIPLKGQSVNEFRQQVVSMLQEIGIDVAIEDEELQASTPGTYAPAAARKYFDVLSRVDLLLKQYKSTLREESGPVVLWPHHFDLAVLWFSGRRVPDQDPDDPEYADEQVNVGFVPGDDNIAEPYFYVTAYPTPEGWVETALPENAYWMTEGFTGAILPYQVLVEADDPAAMLMSYINATQRAAAERMR